MEWTLPSGIIELQAFSPSPSAESPAASDHADQGAKCGCVVAEHCNYGDLVIRKCPTSLGENLVHRITQLLPVCVICFEVAIFLLVRARPAVNGFATGLCTVLLVSTTYALRGMFTIYVPLADTRSKKIMWMLLMLLLESSRHLVFDTENAVCNYLHLCPTHVLRTARVFMEEAYAVQRNGQAIEEEVELGLAWYRFRIRTAFFADWIFASIVLLCLGMGNAPFFVGDYALRILMLNWFSGVIHSFRLITTGAWLELGEQTYVCLEHHVAGLGWAGERMVVMLYLMLVRRRVKYLEAVTCENRFGAKLLLVLGGVQLICFTPLPLDSQIFLPSSSRFALLVAISLRTFGGFCLVIFALVVKQYYTIVLGQVRNGRIRLAHKNSEDPFKFLQREMKLSLFAVSGLTWRFLGMCAYYLICWNGLGTCAGLMYCVRDVPYQMSRVGLVMHAVWLRWPQAIVVQNHQFDR